MPDPIQIQVVEGTPEQLEKRIAFLESLQEEFRKLRDSSKPVSRSKYEEVVVKFSTEAARSGLFGTTNPIFLRNLLRAGIGPAMAGVEPYEYGIKSMRERLPEERSSDDVDKIRPLLRTSSDSSNILESLTKSLGSLTKAVISLAATPFLQFGAQVYYQTVARLISENAASLSATLNQFLRTGINTLFMYSNRYTGTLLSQIDPTSIRYLGPMGALIGRALSERGFFGSVGDTPLTQEERSSFPQGISGIASRLRELRTPSGRERLFAESIRSEFREAMRRSDEALEETSHIIESASRLFLQLFFPSVSLLLRRAKPKDIEDKQERLKESPASSSVSTSGFQYPDFVREALSPNDSIMQFNDLMDRKFGLKDTQQTPIYHAKYDTNFA